MIELVSEARCILCNKCVQVCPMNVFSAVKNAPPMIARKDDCQTCYMCELYCPVDALYVAPDAERSVFVSEAAVETGGLFGSYRGVGWAATQAGTNNPVDQSFRLTSAQ
jgi:NAD-dependent dihydropyrimidine dehydrogenase PreA subunit